MVAWYLGTLSELLAWVAKIALHLCSLRHELAVRDYECCQSKRFRRVWNSNGRVHWRLPLEQHPTPEPADIVTHRAAAGPRCPPHPTWPCGGGYDCGCPSAAQSVLGAACGTRPSRIDFARRLPHCSITGCHPRIVNLAVANDMALAQWQSALIHTHRLPPPPPTPPEEKPHTFVAFGFGHTRFFGHVTLSLGCSPKR